MKKKKPFKIFIHALCDPQTQQGSAGLIIKDPRGRTRARISRHLGRCNEYQAAFKTFMEALREIRRRNIAPVEILSHDENLIHLAQGIYKVMDPIVKQLKNAVEDRYRGLKYELKLIPPLDNTGAEDLARQGLSEYKKSIRENRETLKMPSPGDVLIEPAPGIKAIQAQQHSAGGVVYRREGQHYKICIIAKRDRQVWALPKGRVDQGETPEETAIREVAEETGHLARVEMLLDRIQYYFYWKENNTFYHKFVHFFLMPLEEENKFQRDQEADAVRWVSPGEAYSQVTYLNEKEIIRKAIQIFNALG